MEIIYSQKKTSRKVCLIFFCFTKIRFQNWFIRSKTTIEKNGGSQCEAITNIKSIRVITLHRKKLHFPVYSCTAAGSELLVAHTLRFTCCFRWHRTGHTNWWLRHWFVVIIATVISRAIIIISYNRIHSIDGGDELINDMEFASVFTERCFTWKKFRTFRCRKCQRVDSPAERTSMASQIQTYLTDGQQFTIFTMEMNNLFSCLL